MKNFAKAAAPAAVCLVAARGMTGGRSPGLVFGPVVGTSAGTVGVTGVGVVATEELTAVGVAGALEVGVGVGAGAGGVELVQAATDAATSRHAAIARILRTGR